MADVNTNTATQTQDQGNGTQTNTTANANTTGAGANNTPKVKTEEEIRAELQKEYEKMADKRVTDAIKKKEKEWADKQAKEKMTEDERRQAEEQERLQAQAKRDLDLTIKGLKLDVVDAVQEMGLDAGFRNLIAVEDLATIADEDERNSERGTLKLEGSEAGEVITSSRKTLSNVCQIIEKVTQVSGTARSLNPKGINDVFNSEVQDRLVETKRDMEWYFLNGTKALESGATPRQMNGLVNLVNANNVVETKGALTEDHFLDALQKMWDHGAQGEYFAFVNANIKRMINQLAKAGNNVRFLGDNGSMQNVLGIGVQKIVTDFGEISLVLDRYADTKTILTVDLGEVQIAELRGTFYEDLPKAGDYYKGHVLNESTIKLLNSFAGSKISITEASL